MEKKNKVVVITGANRGIGRALAVYFGTRGYRLGLNWYEDEARTRELEQEFQRDRVECLFTRGDVSKRADVNRLFDAVMERFGTVDVLINNAAVIGAAPATEVTDELFDRIMAVNVKGAFLCAQRAGREMMQRGHGRIINISSIHEHYPKRDSLPYAMSKASLGMLTKGLALEWGPKGIVVMGLAPGGVESTMKDRVPEVLINSTPVRAIASTDEIAEMAEHMASGQTRFLNGTTVVMDGGLTLGPYTRADF